LLAMIRPANDQTVEIGNAYYWDVASNPIKSPFYIDTILRSDSPTDECDVCESQFMDLLRYLGLNEEASSRSPGREKKTYDSHLSRRALALHEILKDDSTLSEADRKQILKYLLLSDNGPVQAGAKDYIGYISAANTFYADDYTTAERLFSALMTSPNTWVKEASLYNLIRVEIRKTQQQSADSHGFFEISKAGQIKANKILPAIQRYLSEFPKGRYTDSARQLKRRAYWLSHDNENLGKSYLDAINDIHNTNDFIAAAELAIEIDDKYLFATPPDRANAKNLPDSLEQIEWDNPVIAAAQILVRLRKPASDDEGRRYNPVSLDAIKSHESNFRQKNALSLYRYLLTAYDFFEEERYDAVVQATDNWKSNLMQADYASFSTAALRVKALEKLNRWPEAAVILKELRELSPSPLLKDHFELAQAQNMETSGHIKKIFEPDSIIQSYALRKRLLQAAANTPLLEYAMDEKHISAKEKSVALAALLNKELLSKQYKSLLEHHKKYAALKLDNIDGLDLLRDETIRSDDNFKCPNWSNVLAELSKDEASPHALLCLGERLRTLEDGFIKPDTPYPDDLGHTDDGFNIKSLTRLSLYTAVIGNASAKSDDKAFALRRALYCFARTGYNHCGEEEIPVEQRKAWFKELKSKYKNSPWSIKQKYYW